MAIHHHYSSHRPFKLFSWLAIVLAILASQMMDLAEAGRRKKVKDEDRQRERGNTLDKVEELEGKKQPPKKEEEKKSEEEKKEQEDGGGGRGKREDEAMNHRHRRHHRETGEKGVIDTEMAKELVNEGKQRVSVGFKRI
jgi:Mg-chelatase subunit ChlI